MYEKLIHSRKQPILSYMLSSPTLSTQSHFDLWNRVLYGINGFSLQVKEQNIWVEWSISASSSLCIVWHTRVEPKNFSKILRFRDSDTLPIVFHSVVFALIRLLLLLLVQLSVSLYCCMYLRLIGYMHWISRLVWIEQELRINLQKIGAIIMIINLQRGLFWDFYVRQVFAQVVRSCTGCGFWDFYDLPMQIISYCAVCRLTDLQIMEFIKEEICCR